MLLLLVSSVLVGGRWHGVSVSSSSIRSILERRNPNPKQKRSIQETEGVDCRFNTDRYIDTDKRAKVPRYHHHGTGMDYRNAMTFPLCRIPRRRQLPNHWSLPPTHRSPIFPFRILPTGTTTTVNAALAFLWRHIGTSIAAAATSTTAATASKRRDETTTTMSNQISSGTRGSNAMSSVDFYRRVPRDLTEVKTSIRMEWQGESPLSFLCCVCTLLC